LLSLAFSSGDNGVQGLNHGVNFLGNLSVWRDDLSDLLDDWLLHLGDQSRWLILGGGHLGLLWGSWGVGLAQRQGRGSALEVKVHWVVRGLHLDHLSLGWLFLVWQGSVLDGAGNLLDGGWHDGLELLALLHIEETEVSLLLDRNGGKCGGSDGGDGGSGQLHGGDGWSGECNSGHWSSNGKSLGRGDGEGLEVTAEEGTVQTIAGETGVARSETIAGAETKTITRGETIARTQEAGAQVTGLLVANNGKFLWSQSIG
jgi:hypothetical protein